MELLYVPSEKDCNVKSNEHHSCGGTNTSQANVSIYRNGIEYFSILIFGAIKCTLCYQTFRRILYDIHNQRRTFPRGNSGSRVP